MIIAPPAISTLSETLAEIERDIKMYEACHQRARTENDFGSAWRYRTILDTLQTDKTSTLADYIAEALR